jgi:hypothetical protein
MSKQTAVEWLQERLFLSLSDELKCLNGFFVIAKEMEKQQIIDAFGVGRHVESTRLIHYNDMAEQYYNETYKNENNV